MNGTQINCTVAIDFTGEILYLHLFNLNNETTTILDL